MNRFPDSVGGRRCHNLIETIEAPNSSITTERVWNQPLPTINVQYKNLNKVYFRVVKYDWAARLKRRGNRRPDYLDQAERQALLGKRPVAAWSVDLPATEDYHQRQEHLPAREDLSIGSYFLISSHTEDFGAQENRVQFTDFWVSKLALVTRSSNGRATVDGFVLDNLTGEPIQEANVDAWRAERTGWVSVGTVTTDADGRFELPQIDRARDTPTTATTTTGEFARTHGPCSSPTAVCIDQARPFNTRVYALVSTHKSTTIACCHARKLPSYFSTLTAKRSHGRRINRTGMAPFMAALPRLATA